MDERRERQFRMEAESVQLGVEHFRRRQQRLAASERRSGEDFIQECFERLCAAIDAEQSRIVSGENSKLRRHDVPLLSLGAEKLALITLRTMLNVVEVKGDGVELRTLTRVAKDLGRACQQERRLDVQLERACDVGALLLGRNHNRWNAERRAKDLALVADSDWSDGNRDLRLGAELINLATAHCIIQGKPAFELRERRPNPTVLHFGTTARAWVDGRGSQHEHMAAPLQLPMLVPPLSWAGLFGGGYLTGATSLVKRMTPATVPAALRGADLSAVYSAVNSLQNTAWRISPYILGVMESFLRKRMPLPGVAMKSRPVPPKLIGSFSDEVLKRHKAERARAHLWNVQAAGNRRILRVRLAIARRLVGQEPLYFPYQLDGRGRIYPIPQLFHPQADDAGRALLEFHHAQGMGEKGLYWFSVQLANLFGNDKETFDERVRWVETHSNEIVASADHPLDEAGLWRKADRPWCFLAACQEWAVLKRSGASHGSRLPVHMDGTCNGLQHLSALGRDIPGGSATNVRPAPRPQDIYQEVAVIASRKVTADRLAGVPTAASWPTVDRTLAKRATMTTPYGVTRAGIRGQLVKHLSEQGNASMDKWLAAGYLAEVLQSAISEVVVKGVEIMDWLKDLARSLALVNKSATWTLPTGFVVAQEYRMKNERRIVTAERTLVIRESPKGARIDTKKQINAIAPNFIHSLDAAHLVMTVNALATVGIESFAMVHDSYGVPARHVDTMNRVLREQFVALHKSEMLEILEAETRARCPDARIRRPPTGGGLMIEEVLRSQYFFA